MREAKVGAAKVGLSVGILSRGMAMVSTPPPPRPPCPVHGYGACNGGTAVTINAQPLATSLAARDGFEPVPGPAVDTLTPEKIAELAAEGRRLGQEFGERVKRMRGGQPGVPDGWPRGGLVASEEARWAAPAESSRPLAREFSEPTGFPSALPSRPVTGEAVACLEVRGTKCNHDACIQWKARSAPPAPDKPACGTCGGRGEVGGPLQSGDSQTDPCPACAPDGPAKSLESALAEAYATNEVRRQEIADLEAKLAEWEEIARRNKADATSAKRDLELAYRESRDLRAKFATATARAEAPLSVEDRCIQLAEALGSEASWLALVRDLRAQLATHDKRIAGLEASNAELVREKDAAERLLDRASEMLGELEEDPNGFSEWAHDFVSHRRPPAPTGTPET